MHGECEPGSVGQDLWHTIIKDTHWSPCEWIERIEWYPLVLLLLEISWILRSVLWLLCIWQLFWCWIILSVLKIKLYLAVKICKHVNNIKLQFLKTEMFIIAKLADLENVMEKYWGLERVNWAMCSPVLLLTGFRILARSLTPEHFHL